MCLEYGEHAAAVVTLHYGTNNGCAGVFMFLVEKLSKTFTLLLELEDIAFFFIFIIIIIKLHKFIIVNKKTKKGD